MLDFNHRLTPAERVVAAIDAGQQRTQAEQIPRSYLGASRVGVACERQLQFEYVKAPVDRGQAFSSQLLRVFEVGHAFEAMAIRWLREAGFDLITEKQNGEQIGFSAINGQLRGHVDGIVVAVPDELAGALAVPMLWECKSMNDKSWKETAKQGVTKSKPVYAAQLALYQAYLEPVIPGLSQNPALFTAINKDTQAIHIELVPFDGDLAQRMSDRAVRVITATDAHELLPRATTTPSHFICKWCAYAARCWSLSA